MARLHAMQPVVGSLIQSVKQPNYFHSIVSKQMLEFPTQSPPHFPLRCRLPASPRQVVSQDDDDGRRRTETNEEPLPAKLVAVGVSQLGTEPTEEMK